MHRLFYTCLTLLLSQVIYAQSYEGSIDYQKTRQSVAMIQLPYQRQKVEDALTEYMAKQGAKSANVKGFTVLRSVRLGPTDTSVADLYFRTETKNRAEKDMTILTLLPIKKNQDLLSRPSGDNMFIPQARYFLDSMAPYVDAYMVNLQFKEQDALVKKARKKLDGLINDQADLDKKLRRLQSDLDENKQQQAKEAANLQSNITADDDAKNKNQKRIRKLLDEEGSLGKKLRRTQSDLDQNKTDQFQQQAEIDKQQQILEAIRAKQIR